jgi:rRNA maturation endonuclease Nob1
MKPPADLTTDQLRPYAAEFARRVKVRTPRARVERPCTGCGRLLSSTERRKACQHCGTRNPR